MQEIISQLQKFLKGKTKFALIYGSILTRYFTEKSDIDLAVYLGKPAGIKAKFKWEEKLEKQFDYKYKFDLVILDSADPIIAMQVLANGRLIVDDDFEAFIKYKSRMISQYLDFKMDRKIIEDRIAEGSVYD